MPERRACAHMAGWWLLLALSLVQCAPASAPSPTAPATLGTPSAVSQLPLTPLPPERRGQSVVLVLLAGARADYTQKFIADGAMPTLARLLADGARADYLQPVDPTLAASAQMAILSGASAARTGAVADLFHKPGQSLSQSSAAFESASAVEPLWRSVMRNGARAALIGFPPSLLNVAALRADLVVSQGGVFAPSAQHVLKFGEAKDWKNLPPSFSAPKEARSSLAGGDLFVLALDTTNDQQENYDTWLFSRAKTIDEQSMRLRLGEWGVLNVDTLLRSVAAFKITDANPAHFAVYQSPITLNQSAPVELAREVLQRFGPPPAAADRESFERNWMDEGTLLQMAEAESEWLAAASALVYRQYKPDLLVLRLGVIEGATREFLLVEPRQPNYTPERAVKYANALRRAYEIADSALARLVIQLDTNTNALLVVSDRGLMPTHTVVNLNRLLVERKWLTLQNANIDLPKSKAYAEASDAIAHIYISLKARNANGTVEQVDYDKLQAELVGALNELKDPADGQPVFARVLRRQELNALGLQHEHSGDVVVQARPGFVLSSARGRSAVLEPAPALGAAGYDASLPALRGIFVVSGAGIRPAQLGAVSPYDLAPTIAALLRLNATTFVEGRALERALR